MCGFWCRFMDKSVADIWQTSTFLWLWFFFFLENLLVKIVSFNELFTRWVYMQINLSGFYKFGSCASTIKTSHPHNTQHSLTLYTLTACSREHAKHLHTTEMCMGWMTLIGKNLFPPAGKYHLQIEQIKSEVYFEEKKNNLVITIK